MKKFCFHLLICVFLSVNLISFAGCAINQSLLDPYNPVTLTMWHVYGEQSDSPIKPILDEFNDTVGQEKGVVINVTLMSNATQIGAKLLDSKADKAGTIDMPDLFFCHKNNALELGVENLIDWKELFTASETESFVKEFVEDGTHNDTLAVLPVSKSTHCLFVAGGVFERFAKAQNVSYQDLATWDGFFEVAEKYYNYSGGKAFCAIDYLLRCVELNALSNGAKDFYTESGWYNFENEKLMDSYNKFANAIAKGHIVVSDLYSNTQVMIGQTIAGIGSSASIL